MASGVTIELDLSALERWEKHPQITHRAIGIVATRMAARVIASFGTGGTPSAPGSPPGIRTGMLKNNIDAVPIRQGAWAVRAKRRYAAALEFGARRGNWAMEPRPFMTPELRTAAAEFPAIWREEMNKK
jgi:hypothetical protein